MYIHRVILENIRCFEKLDLPFDKPDAEESNRYRGWNVITGDNAAGKSTLLKAIALALIGPEIARALQPSLAGWIRNGAEEGTIAVEIKPNDMDSFSGGGRRPKPTFFAELTLTRKNNDVSLSAGSKYVIKSPRSAVKGPWALDCGVWFSSAYGPFRRLYGSSSEAARLMSAPGKPPRYATLFKEDATLAEGQYWLRDLRFRALEGNPMDAQLLNDVQRMLNTDFLRHGLRVDSVDSDDLWLKGKDDVRLPLSEMSDGYRSSLALLIDIIRHLAAAYGPQGIVTEQQGRIVVPHPGVVLIDEIDAHLHPQWQRTIGSWLREHFPNIQFIVSSHSAFVCQAADQKGLYRLPAPDEAGVAHRLDDDEWQGIVAGTPDIILRSEAFGMDHTRSPQAVEARREFGRLSAKKKAAGKLTAEEEKRMHQIDMFINTADSDLSASDC